MTANDELVDRLGLRKVSRTYRRRRRIAIVGVLLAGTASLLVPEFVVLGVPTTVICAYIYNKYSGENEEIASEVEQHAVEQLEIARQLLWEGEKSASIAKIDSLQRGLESIRESSLEENYDDTKFDYLYNTVIDVGRYLKQTENYDWPTEKTSTIIEPKEPPEFSSESVQDLVIRLRKVGMDQSQLNAVRSRIESDQRDLEQTKQTLESDVSVTAAAAAFVESDREERPPISEDILTAHPAGKELVNRAREMEAAREKLGFRVLVDAAVTSEAEADQQAESDSNTAETAYNEAASYYARAAELANETYIEVVKLEETALSKPELTAVDGIGQARAEKLERIGIESPSELRDKEKLTEAKGFGERRAESLIEARDGLLEDYLRHKRERVEEKRAALASTEEKREEASDPSNRSVQVLVEQLARSGANQAHLEALQSRVESEQQTHDRVKQALEQGAPVSAAEAFIESSREDQPPIPEEVGKEHPAGEELVTRVHTTKTTLDEFGFRALVDAAVSRDEKGNREAETDPKSAEKAYDEAATYYARAAQLASEADYEVEILEETALSKPKLTDIDGIGTGRAGPLRRIGIESPSDLTDVVKLTEVKGIGETTAKSLIEARRDLLENYLREHRERVEEKRASLPPSNEEQVAELVKTTTEALDAADDAIPTDLSTATEHLDRVEDALADNSIEDERAVPEDLTSIKERLSELRVRVRTEKAQREFDNSMSTVDDLLDQLETAADRGEYDRAIGYTGPIRQQLDKAAGLQDDLGAGASKRIESCEKRLERLTTRASQAQHRETFEKNLQEIETTVDNGVEADANVEYTVSAKAYNEAQEEVEDALEVAYDAEYAEVWELERRLEQIKSAKVRAIEQRDEDWETRCATATSQVDRANRELEKVDQYLDIGDEGAAYNSYQAANEAVDEARSTLRTGHVPSERECWDEVDDMQMRVDEVGDKLASHGIDQPMVSHDELLAYLKELAIIFDESPSAEFVRTYGIYPVDEYEEAFGSWSEVLNAANLEPVESRSRRQYSRTNILDSIIAVAEKLGEHPEAAEFNEHGEMSSTTVTNRFGAWEAAIALAGLTEEPTLEVVREHADAVEATRSNSDEQSRTFTYTEDETDADDPDDDENDPNSSDGEGEGGEEAEDEDDFSGFRERRQKRERLKNS
ncbi:homing endonuclease associated repeat-containing protein [Natronorubrum sp. DTA7]|uniref:homing endonuclease associated repeat-containing protein n=1 Tax=Natronorubrum sp. DTA7 TaxID=3447016 RepID=UPI003F824857